MSKIKIVILDWAGTMIDYGCFAPVNAFITAFEHYGISPTIEETREPMGLPKRAHIARMLEGERLSSLWMERNGSAPTTQDINNIYDQFEPALFAALPSHAELLPGALETLEELGKMGISIGSTTGYTQAMMDVVLPLAKVNGYTPDCLVCPDEVGGIGRPFPYMLWRNLEKLRATSIQEVLKVGDTAVDMQEAKNAGCLSAGVLKGSSMLGLTREELQLKSDSERLNLFNTAEMCYRETGADFVIPNIASLPSLIRSIDQG
ncbi:MAG: phosphonoacetaldehyde hydrolase [Coriobacteriia bacterium]|nr:phosphonoacetaldehyde hydrolase [Coriobacteriia bacterium]